MAAIDAFDWGRGALQFCYMNEADFEYLAHRIGKHAAFEMLLLALARRVGTNTTRIEQARSLGIPLVAKNWSSLSALMKNYNTYICVAEAHDVPSCRSTHAASSGDQDQSPCVKSDVTAGSTYPPQDSPVVASEADAVDPTAWCLLNDTDTSADGLSIDSTRSQEQADEGYIQSADGGAKSDITSDGTPGEWPSLATASTTKKVKAHRGFRKLK